MSEFAKVEPFSFGKMRAYAYNNMVVLVRDERDGGLQRVEISRTAAKPLRDWLTAALGDAPRNPP